MAIIQQSDSDYNERLEGIRILVNNAYEDMDLPDSVIENTVNLGDANDKIDILVPERTGLAPVYIRRLKRAVQLECAISLLLSESRLRGEDVEEQQALYESNSIKNTIDAYRAEVSDIIADVGPAVGKFIGYVKATNPPQRF